MLVVVEVVGWSGVGKGGRGWSGVVVWCDSLLLMGRMNEEERREEWQEVWLDGWMDGRRV